MPWDQNWPRLGGHNFEHRNKKGKPLNTSFKLKGLELCGPLPSLFICCPQSQTGSGGGGGVSKFEHRNKEAQLQNSSFLKLEGQEL